MKLIRWGPALAWMALVFFLSSQSQLPTPEEDWLDFIFEKSAHLFEFAVLAALLLLALDPRETERRRAFRVALFLTWLYALSDEFHQRFVPGRSTDWSDILFDWVGAIVGAWLFSYLWTIRHDSTTV